MVKEFLAAYGYHKKDEWNDSIREKIKTLQEKLAELTGANEILKVQLREVKADKEDLLLTIREQNEADEFLAAMKTIQRIQKTNT